MSKTPSSKSIIANFALSTSEADPAPAPRPRSQPVARVGAGVIGATQRTLSDIRDERDRLQALVATGGGLELDPTAIDPSPFPDRLPDDTDSAFEEFKKLLGQEGQKSRFRFARTQKRRVGIRSSMAIAAGGRAATLASR